MLHLTTNIKLVKLADHFTILYKNICLLVIPVGFNFMQFIVFYLHCSLPLICCIEMPYIFSSRLQHETCLWC